jgi:DNA-binding transcriptional ArsR family regulator
MKGNSINAELAWFHVFKAMIDDGEVAKIGASAFTTYCVIKSHTNFATGVAFPSIETISEKSGISERQVRRDLLTLEENGLLTKEKEWKSNVYTLREKILITDDTGKPAGQATWDYLPDAVRGAVADLKNVLLSGQFADAKIVMIENLQVNVIKAEAGSTVNAHTGPMPVGKSGKTRG